MAFKKEPNMGSFFWLTFLSFKKGIPLLAHKLLTERKLTLGGDSMFFENEEQKVVKTWGVKLSEDKIKELEDLFQSSGMKYKNEFMEHLMETYKVNLLEKGTQGNHHIHPHLLQQSTGDMYELTKLTQRTQQLFLQQLEKHSVIYEENQKLQEHIRFLQDEKMYTQPFQPEKSFSSNTSKKHISKPSQTLIIGEGGEGKHPLIKQEILRTAKTGQQIILLDTFGEMKQLTNSLGGVYFSLDSQTNTLNPIETFSNKYSDFVVKTKFLISLLETSLETTFDAKQRTFLQQTFLSYYATVHPISSKEFDNVHFSTLQEVLFSQKNITEEESAFLTTLDKGLSSFPFYRTNRTISSPKNKILTFDCSQFLGSATYTLPVYMTVINFISDLMRHRLLIKPKIFIEDMIMQFFHSENSCEFLLHFLSFAKEHRADVWLTSCVFHTNAYNEKICNQVDTILLFRASSISETFPYQSHPLSGSIKPILSNLPKGTILVYKHNTLFIQNFESNEFDTQEEQKLF